MRFLNSLVHDFAFIDVFPVFQRMVEKLQPESTVKACSDGAPFSSNVTYIKKIFLVAEVDDTYIYHIHLGS